MYLLYIYIRYVVEHFLQILFFSIVTKPKLLYLLFHFHQDEISHCSVSLTRRCSGFTSKESESTIRRRFRSHHPVSSITACALDIILMQSKSFLGRLGRN
jgi:hypothetical protein